MVATLTMRVATVMPAAKCGACSNGRTPFCVRLRNAGDLAPLVSDPGFLPAIMARIGASELGLGGMARSEGLGPVQSSSLAAFQLAGCYAAAMALLPDADWEASRRAIDRLISTGVSSLRNL